MSAFLYAPPTRSSPAVEPRARQNPGGTTGCRVRIAGAAVDVRVRSCGARGKVASIAMSGEVGDVNKTDLAVDDDSSTSTSTSSDDVFRPDRDVEKQAYQSTEGWQLKYHDIKTRRDAADDRAKARDHQLQAKSLEVHFGWAHSSTRTLVSYRTYVTYTSYVVLSCSHMYVYTTYTYVRKRVSVRWNVGVGESKK